MALFPIARFPTGNKPLRLHLEIAKSKQLGAVLGDFRARTERWNYFVGRSRYDFHPKLSRVSIKRL